MIPELYVVTIGISDYEDSKIRLRYAAKDAEDFAKAMKIGGERLFGESKCHITVLNTSGKEGIIQKGPQWIAWAMRTAAQPITNQMKRSGSSQRTHLDQGIPRMPSAAMK